MTEATMIVAGRKIRCIVEEDGRIPIDSYDQIPKFTNEAEEAAFWLTHTLSGNYWHSAKRGAVMTPDQIAESIFTNAIQPLEGLIAKKDPNSAVLQQIAEQLKVIMGEVAALAA